MTKQELIEVILTDYYDGFAASVAKLVVCDGDIEPLYELSVGDFATGANPAMLLTAPQRTKIVFRAAYVLETIYFNHPLFFDPFRQRFFSDFPNTYNASAKRHFAKMMAYELRNADVRELLSVETCDGIAQACVRWITEPKAAVAVQIWAVEVLLLLKGRVEWVSEVLSQLGDILRREPSAAMQVRLRGWRF